MPKNYCIMQIWAESGKSALPICNYSQILYQFLTFTQNLKRSLRLRPWAEMGGCIATNATTFNRELLIVEKSNDGKPFENAVFGNHGYHEKMDRSQAGLGTDPFPARNLF